MPQLKQETQLPFAFPEPFPRDSKVLSGVTHSWRKLVSAARPCRHLLTTLSAEATLFSAQCVWETEPILCVRYLAYILILILPLRLKSVPILQMQWTQQITKKLWKVEPKFKTLPLLSFLHTQVHACVRTHCQDRLVRRHTLSSIQIYLVNKCQHWSSGFILASLMHHQVEVRGPGARQHVSAAPYFPVFQNHRGVNIVTQWK